MQGSIVIDLGKEMVRINAWDNRQTFLEDVTFAAICDGFNPFALDNTLPLGRLIMQFVHGVMPRQYLIKAIAWHVSRRIEDMTWRAE